MSDTGLNGGIAAIASLAEPTRRALYLYVRARGAPVSRDEAAAGVGVPRHTAKFHLDKLADDGLLVTEFARRGERRGPGAGRPAKFYRLASSRELIVTLPERRYELAGQLMARAIADARSTRRSIADALHGAASDYGHKLAERARGAAGDRPSRTMLLNAVRAVLDQEGYESRTSPAGLTLANCPFRALAIEHTAVICPMNLAIMQGLLAGLGKLRLAPVFEPAEGRCCIRLAAQGSAGA